MDKKITFPELVDLVAQAASTSKRVSETFLKSFFDTISERLEAGESVKINGLGTFKIVEVSARKSINVNTGEEIEIPSHGKISFTPDKKLADAVNEPFAGFETITLEDEISEENLEEVSREEQEAEIIIEANVPDPAINDTEEYEDDEPLVIATPPVFNPAKFATPAEVPAPEPEQAPVAVVEETKPTQLPVAETEATESTFTKKTENSQEEETSSANEPVAVSNYDDDEDEEEDRPRRSHFWCGLAAGIAVTILVLGTAAWLYSKLSIQQATASTEKQELVTPANDTPESCEKTEVADSLAKEAKTFNETQPAVVTDTIAKNYYLAKMARRHYGDYHFWIYIYQENRNIIADPNNVAIGTVLVIPDEKKYGIDKNNPESIANAQTQIEMLNDQ